MQNDSRTDTVVKNKYLFSFKELEERVRVAKRGQKEGFLRFYIKGREYTYFCEDDATPKTAYSDYVVIAQNQPKQNIESRFIRLTDTENELKILKSAGVHHSYLEN